MITEIELDLPTGCGRYAMVNQLSNDLGQRATVVVHSNHSELAKQYKVSGGIVIRRPKQRCPRGADLVIVSAVVGVALGPVADHIATFANEVDRRRRATQVELEYHVDTWINHREHGVRVTHLASGISSETTTPATAGASMRVYGMRDRMYREVIEKAKLWKRDKHIQDDPMGYAKQTLQGATDWVQQNGQAAYRPVKILLSPDMYMRVRDFAGSTFLGLPFLVDSEQDKPMMVKYGV